MNFIYYVIYFICYIFCCFVVIWHSCISFTVCKVSMIGTPLFIRKAGPTTGAWMHDPIRQNGFPVWETRGNSGKYLYEYRSVRSFEDGVPDKTYELSSYQFKSSNHALYNNSFFYQSSNHSIACFDLQAEGVSSGFRYEGQLTPLYKDGNYFDIESDENGLWIIFARNETIYVQKADTFTMRIERTWKIEQNAMEFGNGFISCGVLYLVRNTNTQVTVIDFAYDLYTSKSVPIKIKFINPFRKNSMISYFPDKKNPGFSRLYGWDNGRQIMYRLLFS